MTNNTVTSEDINALKAISNRVARLVCGGNIVTKAEAEELIRLENHVGAKWDAVNMKWQDLDEED